MAACYLENDLPSDLRTRRLLETYEHVLHFISFMRRWRRMAAGRQKREGRVEGVGHERVITFVHKCVSEV